MPSIQSKAINVMLHLMRMKRTVNRMRQRVEIGERTYTEPSPRLHRKHQISKRELNGHLVWTIAPKEKPSGKHVIYLHGGAYVNSFAPQHWDLMSKLVQAANCTVTAPNYPHAPEYYVGDVFALMLPLYNELAAAAGSSNITIMGDSSGGGIALALAQRLRGEGIAQPGRLILLSPWLDATLSNPEIAEFDKIDPFLGVDGLKYGGAVYARDVDPKSYLVSPVYGSVKTSLRFRCSSARAIFCFPTVTSSEIRRQMKVSISIIVSMTRWSTTGCLDQCPRRNTQSVKSSI
jgi:acetyl esterase/lipase